MRAGLVSRTRKRRISSDVLAREERWTARLERSRSSAQELSGYGAVQPLAEIGQLCRKYGAFFHTDAAQAAGKISLDVNAMNIDLMSISGHKLHGPKGVGALYVRRKPRVRIEAVQSGGGQERGIRSGTVPTQLVVGLGAAAKIAHEEFENDNRHVKMLWDRLYQVM